MATCHNCGYELEPGAKACRSCATPVPQEPPPPGGATPSRDAGATSPVGATPPPGAPPPPMPGAPAPPPPGAPPPPPGAPAAGSGGSRRVDPRWWLGGLGGLIVVLVIVLVIVLTSGGSSSRTVVTTTTTTTSPPPPTAPPSPTPTANQIAQQLAQTRDPQTGASFQLSDMSSIPDGAGGMLTEVSGFDQSVNHPPCLVFFWHDDTFIGTDSPQTHMGCVLVHSGDGAFVVDYAVFAPTDPLCCPSGSDDVTYTWNGRSFAPNGAPPASQ